MLHELSRAPVWVQVFVALALFFFVALPVIAAIVILLIGRVQKLAQWAESSRGANTQRFARLTEPISLFARVIGFICLLALFAVWTAFPLYVLLSSVIFAVLDDAAGRQLPIHIASSALVALGTYTVLELTVRRMPLATALWQHAQSARSNSRNVPTSTFIRGARLLGTICLFVLIFLIAL